MHELEHGRLYRFKDWPIDAVPKEPGVYTVWNEVSEFLYVGIAKKGHLEGKNGLRGRLGSHANGRRGGDQFNVYALDVASPAGGLPPACHFPRVVEVIVLSYGGYVREYLR